MNISSSLVEKQIKKLLGADLNNNMDGQLPFCILELKNKIKNKIIFMYYYYCCCYYNNLNYKHNLHYKQNIIRFGNLYRNYHVVCSF